MPKSGARVIPLGRRRRRPAAAPSHLYVCLRERPRASVCESGFVCAPAERASVLCEGVCVFALRRARTPRLGAWFEEEPRERRLCASSRLSRDSGRSHRRHCLMSPKSLRGAAGRADGRASAAAAAGSAGRRVGGGGEEGGGRRCGDDRERREKCRQRWSRPPLRRLPQMLWGPGCWGRGLKKASPSFPTGKKGALKMTGESLEGGGKSKYPLHPPQHRFSENTIF